MHFPILRTYWNINGFQHINNTLKCLGVNIVTIYLIIVLNNVVFLFQVLSPPSTSYQTITSPSSTSYFSTNSSSNISTTGDTNSSGAYGPSHAPYARNHPLRQVIQQPPAMSSSHLPQRRLLPETTRHLQSSRVSFIGQGGGGEKIDTFSTCTSSFGKSPQAVLPAVHFNNSSPDTMI